ncbi:MAG: ABC transporter substrate-binding protein [Pseudomonadota bacterium]
MRNNTLTTTRRTVLAGALAMMAAPAFALSEGDATNLVSKLVSDIQKTIDSGKTGNALINDFKKIFDTYADVPIIARSSLGVTWRSATDAQRRAYSAAFRSYVAEKYGNRFDEFSGAEITVTGANKTKRGYVVNSTAKLPSGSSVAVEWQVSDASGSAKVFDIYIEGISMLVTERGEIGAMLDARGGNLDQLIADIG